jgi:hypothetical protein
MKTQKDNSVKEKSDTCDNVVLSSRLFLIWDLDSKMFLKGDFSLGVETCEIRGKYGEKFENLIPLQNTGLKDKNGFEIYEQFILQFNDGDKFVVYFKNGSYGYDSVAFKEFITLSDTNLSIATIIGNTFGTPELL